MTGSVRNTSLRKTSFTVEGMETLKIYANSRPEKSAAPKNGKYIVIELKNSNDMSKLKSKDYKGADTEISLKQNAGIFFTGGKYFKTEKTLKNNRVKRLVIEDFKQFEFSDPQTGVTLKYNLYIPKKYSKNKKYPLVLFMHDSGPLSENTEMALMQGNGATSWAEPEFQARHESFVLAPQYSVKTVNDESEATPEVEATKNLLDYLQTVYSIDQDRLYTTGQSMGGMMSLYLNSRYPDLFAASYYVACQWDPAVMSAASKNKAWIVVSTGDSKAFPGMNAITEVFEKNGGIVEKAEWKGNYTEQQFDKAVKDVIAANPEANVYYTTLEKGTIPNLPPDNKGSEHVFTWTVAYNIDGIKEWIFRQSK